MLNLWKEESTYCGSLLVESPIRLYEYETIRPCKTYRETKPKKKTLNNNAKQYRLNLVSTLALTNQFHDVCLLCFWYSSALTGATSEKEPKKYFINGISWNLLHTVNGALPNVIEARLVAPTLFWILPG
jgi:hypothetical protein